MRGLPFITVAVLSAAVALLPSAVRADPPFSLQRTAVSLDGDRTFTPAERRIVRAYFADRPETGRTGAVDPGGPVGQELRFVAPERGAAIRGEGLARGSARRLPAALESRLPRRLATYRRVIVGADVVLVDTLTNRAIDILEDAVRERG